MRDPHIYIVIFNTHCIYVHAGQYTQKNERTHTPRWSPRTNTSSLLPQNPEHVFGETGKGPEHHFEADESRKDLGLSLLKLD